MMIDPLAFLTREDRAAIERQGEHDATMRALQHIKEDIDRKFNEIKLNQDLQFNVKSVILEYFKEEYNLHGEFFICKTIEFIKNNCQLSIANKKESIRIATKMAINYYDFDKIIKFGDIFSIYDDLTPSFREQSIKAYYNHCRDILFHSSEIINYVFGTRITEKTTLDKQFAIHEEIINGLRNMDSSKVENCPDEYKENIKKLLLAIRDIRIIENNKYPEIKCLVKNYKTLYEQIDYDESNLKMLYKHA